MEALYPAALIVSVFCAIGFAIIVIFVSRRASTAERELAALQEARAALERDFAVERDRTSRIERELGVARSEVTKERAARAEVEITLATVRETLGQERQQSDEKLKLLLEARETMTREFQVLANDLLLHHGETFTKQNKEQLDGLLTPLREKLKEFQEGLQAAHTDSKEERAALDVEIRHLLEQSVKTETKTVELTQALTGEVQTQGAWGEMVLESLLEKSGLREGDEYVRQATIVSDDGQRLRPDVILKLPGGRQVIIDSKVALEDFYKYVNAEVGHERDEYLKGHLASLRNHIRELSSKDYQATAKDALDYVIMFVPIEGALAVALHKDPELTSYAVQKNVAISTPTTLMVALRTIDNVWKFERRNRNADEIATRAGLLYRKFVNFVEDITELGQRFAQAQSAYQDAINKLKIGPGNLIWQAEKLKELGAKTTKSLPKELLGNDAAPPAASAQR